MRLSRRSPARLNHTGLVLENVWVEGRGIFEDATTTIRSINFGPDGRAHCDGDVSVRCRRGKRFVAGPRFE